MIIFFQNAETAMGHKRIGKDDDGFKYAMVSIEFFVHNYRGKKILKVIYFNSNFVKIRIELEFRLNLASRL